SASALAGSAEHALSIVFRTAQAGLVRRRVRALVLMMGLAVLAGTSTVLTGLATAWSGSGGLGIAIRALGVAGGIALDLGFFLVAYRALTPEGGPTVRTHLPGAVLMTATGSSPARPPSTERSAPSSASSPSFRSPSERSCTGPSSAPCSPTASGGSRR